MGVVEIASSDSRLGNAYRIACANEYGIVISLFMLKLGLGFRRVRRPRAPRKRGP